MLNRDEGAEAARLRSSTDSHMLIKGRRWRRTDPAIEETLRQALVDSLMDSRRAVKGAMAADDEAAIEHARSEVHDAKVALGERGPKWWLATTDTDVEQRVAAAMRSLQTRTDEWSTSDVRARLRL